MTATELGQQAARAQSDYMSYSEIDEQVSMQASLQGPECTRKNSSSPSEGHILQLVHEFAHVKLR